MPEVELDKARLEIFFNKLDQSLNESQEVVKYLSASPIVREAGEALEALYLPTGEAVDIASGILMHFMNVTRGIRYMIANRYNAEGIGIYEGDQFVNNDAYIGGMHCPDTCLIEPFFYKGEHIGWAGCVSHTSETGGIEPMGMCPSAKEAWHDGMIVPMVKLVERSSIRRDVMGMLLRGTRDAATYELDMKARLAGNERLVRKLTELVDEFGVDFFKRACRKFVQEGKELFRLKLREMRPGIYSARTYCDTTGGGPEKLAVIQLDMEITEDGQLIIRCPVVSPQQPCFNNAYLPAAEATVIYTLLDQFLWDTRWNSGAAELITLDIPKGSRINADSSQSVGYSTVGIAMQVSTTLTIALSRAFYATGKPEEAQAGGPPTCNFGMIAGVDGFGRPFGGYFIPPTYSMGCGGRFRGDGFPNYALFNPWNNIADVEGDEAKMSVLYLAWGFVSGSAGVGKYRSSYLVHSVIAAHNVSSCVIIHNGQGGRISSGQGIFGGYPGPKTRVRLVSNTDLNNRIKNGEPIPQDPSDVDTIKNVSGDFVEYGASVGAISCKSGDIADSYCAPSAGFGDPLEREPKLVLEDYRGGLIGIEDARRQFRVVIDAEAGEVDYSETENLRGDKVKERLRQGVPGNKFLKTLVKRRKERNFSSPVLEFFDELVGFSSAFRAQVTTEEELATKEWAPLGKTNASKELFDLSPYLKVMEDKLGNKVIVCSKCGFGYCDAKEDYKLYALIYERDPEEVYSKHLAPDKEFGVYREFYCPGCGTQIEVEQCPTCMTIIPDIQIKGISY